MRRLLVVLLAVCCFGPLVSADVNDYNSSLVLLMHMNQSPANPTWFNDSTGRHIFTTNGNSITNATIKQLGNASAYFDGSTDWIDTPDSADFAFGANCWTVSMWIQRAGGGGTLRRIFGQLASTGADATTGLGAQWDTSNRVVLAWYDGAYRSMSSTTTVSDTTTFHQLVFRRNLTHITMYIDGVEQTPYATTAAFADQTTKFSIGRSGEYVLNTENGYIDEFAIWNNASSGTPTISDLYPQPDEIVYPPPSGAAGESIVASFTSSSNPSTLGSVVTFTDTSTGTPTTWNWTIDGSVTNTTENAAYLFSAVGTYPITLNVTNATGHFSEVTNNQVVANVSGFTQQDLWMAGEYTLTLTVVDGSTSAPIAGANVTDSTGQATTTSAAGVATLAEDAGPIVIYTSADGYYSAISSYVVDSSEAHTIRLTREVAPPSSSVNTLYSPQNVHLTIVDAYGVPQVGALVNVTYIASSLPNTSVNWLISNYGVNESVAGDMVNSAVVQRDYTESTGGFVFTALPVIRYGITVTNVTTGMNHRVEIMPKDSHYTIYCPLTGQAKTNNTLLARQNATLPWYSLNNTHLMMGMTYQDTTSCTSSVLFRVWFQINGTEIHNTTWSGIGSSLILDNHTIPKAPIGTEYLWQYNATRVC